MMLSDERHKSQLGATMIRADWVGWAMDAMRDGCDARWMRYAMDGSDGSCAVKWATFQPHNNDAQMEMMRKR